MITSMTGFSTLNLDIPTETKNVRLTLTLKSLNSRFFEATCKLPIELNNLETEFIKYFKSELIRGTIYFSIYSTGKLADVKIEPSITLVQSYLDAFKQIKNNFPELSLGNITFRDISELPYIFTEQDSPLTAEIIETIKSAVKKLVENLKVGRKLEGEALHKDFLNRIKIIADAITIIEPRAHIVMEARKESLIQAIQTAQVSGSEMQILSLATQLDKAGINEEIVRLKNHLLNLKELVNNSDLEKGKKIDFILQEILRETNTIASKSNDAEISNSVITIKVELEKIREQALNII